MILDHVMSHIPNKICINRNTNAKMLNTFTLLANVLINDDFEKKDDFTPKISST